MTKTLTLSLITFAVMSCCRYTPQITAQIDKPTIPVLAKKSASATIMLTLINSDTLLYTIDEVAVSLRDTTDLGDIKTVCLYSLPQKNGRLITDRIDTEAPLCRT